jgi:hypothetical protein
MGIRIVAKRTKSTENEKPLYEGTFDGTIVTIGSDPLSTIHLIGRNISPEQAIIILEDNQLLLINREEGTIFNGDRLLKAARQPIGNGDIITIADYSISFLFESNADLKETKAESTKTEDQKVTNESNSKTDEPTQTETKIVPPTKSFASILDSLRTEEDVFYFTVEGGDQDGKRIPLEGSTVEILIGLDLTNQQICFDPAAIATPCAVIRKDWSGVIASPHKEGALIINGQLVQTEQRLHNNDQLSFSPNRKRVNNRTDLLLIFHEPASIVALDSLLPQQLPPPVAPQQENNKSKSEESIEENRINSNIDKKDSSVPRLFFGLFTLFEISLIIVGTLIGATIIFLILNST